MFSEERRLQQDCAGGFLLNAPTALAANRSFRGLIAEVTSAIVGSNISKHLPE
jgi:hypothetical protein